MLDENVIRIGLVEGLVFSLQCFVSFVFKCQSNSKLLLEMKNETLVLRN